MSNTTSDLKARQAIIGMTVMVAGIAEVLWCLMQPFASIALIWLGSGLAVFGTFLCRRLFTNRWRFVAAMGSIVLFAGLVTHNLAIALLGAIVALPGALISAKVSSGKIIKYDRSK